MCLSQWETAKTANAFEAFENLAAPQDAYDNLGAP